MVIIPLLIYMGSVIKLYSYEMGILLFVLWSFFTPLKTLFIDKKIKITNTKINPLLLLFVFIGLIYIVLSYSKFFDIFCIANFNVEIKYILRHSIFIILLITVIFTYKINTKLIFTKKHLKILNVLTTFSYIIILFTKKCVNVNQNLFLLFILFINFTQSKKKINIIFILIGILLPTTTDGTMTIFISRILLIIFIIFNNFEVQKKMINSFILIVVIGIASIVILNINENIIEFQDPNVKWRYNFWVTEIQLLKDTKFLGVGFGTPYVAPNFMPYVSEVSGPFASTNIHSTYDLLYIIGQHSSIVNIFYRMGLGGVLFFVGYHISIIQRTIKGKNKSGSIILFYFLLNLCTIFFNVGLESPHYLLGYITSLFLLIFINDNILQTEPGNFL